MPAIAPTTSTPSSPSNTLKSWSGKAADDLPANNPSESLLAPPPFYRPRASTSSSVSRPAPSYDTDTPIINALAFDGGGIRGAASAVVIDTIMRDYYAATGETVNPADLFQLMGGTSTGGLIAIVLGRLAVATKDLVTIYETLSKQLFGYKLTLLRLLITGSRYPGASAKLLFSNIVEEHAPEGDSGVLNSMGNNSVGVPKCNVFVTATNKADATGDPLIISSYSQDSITIADAARATTAAPFFFPRKRLPDGTVALDGGLVANNPTELVIEEAGAQYGPSVHFNLLLSIGTGKKRPSTFPEISVWSIIPFCQTLGDIATESEKIHKRVEARFQAQRGLGEYVRINIPDIGDIRLDDYKSIPEIVEATKEYMETEEMKRTRHKIATLLSQRKDPQKIDKTP